LNPLSGPLDLSAAEKNERGLVYTPREIAQQPGTWVGTFDRLQPRSPEISNFLAEVGVIGPAKERPTVFLIGAGT
jgi:tagatose-6-phosphate ketose/aldose isomerase